MLRTSGRRRGLFTRGLGDLTWIGPNLILGQAPKNPLQNPPSSGWLALQALCQVAHGRQCRATCVGFITSFGRML